MENRFKIKFIYLIKIINMSRDVSPEIIGPGTWDFIHNKAIRATTPEKKKEFVTMMEDLAETFGCENCRQHIQRYLKENPITDYDNSYDENGNDVGYFTWSWAFHNTVNARIHKPFVDYETAYRMYSTDDLNVCSEVCMVKDHKNNNNHNNVSNSNNNVNRKNTNRPRPRNLASYFNSMKPIY
ncbi:MAG: ERV1/ALR-related protein [Romboutsia sp.]|nr:ERV1/ALR-related protein [Romboutsia sp.]